MLSPDPSFLGDNSQKEYFLGWKIYLLLVVGFGVKWLYECTGFSIGLWFGLSWSFFQLCDGQCCTKHPVEQAQQIDEGARCRFCPSR